MFRVKLSRLPENDIEKLKELLKNRFNLARFFSGNEWSIEYDTVSKKYLIQLRQADSIEKQNRSITEDELMDEYMNDQLSRECIIRILEAESGNSPAL